MLATGLAMGTAVNAWALAPSVLVLGLGMGAGFATIYDVALGDVLPEKAGSVSSSLSVVQQIANALGSVLVTTIYFSTVATRGQLQGSLAALVAICVILLICLACVRLPPREAPARHGG